MCFVSVESFDMQGFWFELNAKAAKARSPFGHAPATAFEPARRLVEEDGGLSQAELGRVGSGVTESHRRFTICTNMLKTKTIERKQTMCNITTQKRSK